MEIYLLRHGIAEDAPAGGSDEARSLTEEGKKKLRDVLAVARKAGVQPDVILTSPYRRAQQTAKIAAAELGYQGDLMPSDKLEPMGDPPGVWQEIRTHRGAKQILLAGHEPLFGNTAAYLLGVPALLIDFKKAGMIRIDVDGLGPHPRGVLEWMLVPKLAG